MKWCIGRNLGNFWDNTFAIQAQHNLGYITDADSDLRFTYDCISTNFHQIEDVFWYGTS